MDISDRIARRLDAWMKSRPDLDTLKKVAARSGVSYGTAQRMRAGGGNITVENLAAVSKAFGQPPTALIEDGEKVREHTPEYANLHETERDLINWYRHTSGEARKMLQLIMQANPLPQHTAPESNELSHGARQILDTHEQAKKKLARVSRQLTCKTTTSKTQEKPYLQPTHLYATLSQLLQKQ